jgi:hypothetical protein
MTDAEILYRTVTCFSFRLIRLRCTVLSRDVIQHTMLPACSANCLQTRRCVAVFFFEHAAVSQTANDLSFQHRHTRLRFETATSIDLTMDSYIIADII